MGASPHHSHAHEHEHATPGTRLFRMLYLDRRDLVTIALYAIFAGLLTLAVPIASQALVSSIAQGQSNQQLVVLSGAVLVFLLFSGALQLLQLQLVERLQQRIFVRVAMNLGERIPRIRQDSLVGEYAPELVNRFFDVLTIQKAFAKLTLDGLEAMLKVIVGLALLAFYSPILLGFDIVLVVFGAFVVGVLGLGGLKSSIQESKEKYRVAAWLEELARCHTTFKMSGTLDFLIERTDDLAVRYVQARRSHFRVLFRQAVGNYIFYAFASAGILAIGGWLIINRQLTIGQLVAAEIVVITVLAGFDKLVKQLEHIYDLLTGIDKVGHVEDLPIERESGTPMTRLESGGAGVECRALRFGYLPGVDIITGLDFKLKPGERVSVVGSSGAGKSTLAMLICGLLEPIHGAVEINGLDVRDADLDSLRRIVGIVGDREDIFEGTILENLTVGAEWVSREDVRKALEMVQLTDEIAALPEGLKTELVSGGHNISRGQVQRLLLARVLARRPHLLILDEAFTGIDERTKLKILDGIYQETNTWTIIDISYDSEVVARSGTVHLLSNGAIVESGAPEELALRRGSEFTQLFPELARQLVASRLSP